MKRIYQLMLLAAGCVLLAAACSDDDDSYLVRETDSIRFASCLASSREITLRCEGSWRTVVPRRCTMALDLAVGRHWRGQFEWITVSATHNRSAERTATIYLGKRGQAISDHRHAGRRGRCLRHALRRGQSHRTGTLEGASLLHLCQCLRRRDDCRELYAGWRFAGTYGRRNFCLLGQRRRDRRPRYCGYAHHAGICGLYRFGRRYRDRLGACQGLRHERNADRRTSREMGVLSCERQYRGCQCPESQATRLGDVGAQPRFGGRQGLYHGRRGRRQDGCGRQRLGLQRPGMPT